MRIEPVIQSFSLWNEAPPGLSEIVSEKTLRLDDAFGWHRYEILQRCWQSFSSSQTTLSSKREFDKDISGISLIPLTMSLSTIIAFFFLVKLGMCRCIPTSQFASVFVR